MFQLLLSAKNIKKTKSSKPKLIILKKIIKNLERLRAANSAATPDRSKDTSNPFVHTSHGNPAFTPQKAGKGGVTVSKKSLVNHSRILF